MKILLIDENKVLRDSYANEFTKAGHDVTAFETADMLEAPGFNLQDHDAIMTDCEPRLRNGLYVVRFVEAEHRPIPCLMHHFFTTVLTRHHGEVVLPDLTKERNWLQFHHRAPGRVRYIWNFLDEVERNLL